MMDDWDRNLRHASRSKLKTPTSLKNTGQKWKKLNYQSVLRELSVMVEFGWRFPMFDREYITLMRKYVDITSRLFAASVNQSFLDSLFESGHELNVVDLVRRLDACCTRLKLTGKYRPTKPSLHAYLEMVWDVKVSIKNANNLRCNHFEHMNSFFKRMMPQDFRQTVQVLPCVIEDWGYNFALRQLGHNKISYTSDGSAYWDLNGTHELGSEFQVRDRGGNYIYPIRFLNCLGLTNSTTVDMQLINPLSERLEFSSEEVKHMVDTNMIATRYDIADNYELYEYVRFNRTKKSYTVGDSVRIQHYEGTSKPLWVGTITRIAKSFTRSPTGLHEFPLIWIQWLHFEKDMMGFDMTPVDYPCLKSSMIEVGSFAEATTGPFPAESIYGVAELIHVCRIQHQEANEGPFCAVKFDAETGRAIWCCQGVESENNHWKCLDAVYQNFEINDGPE